MTDQPLSPVEAAGDGDVAGDSGDVAGRQFPSSAGELSERMGLRFASAEPAQVVATMPVEGNRQPTGLLHGGASAVLAETLGSMHAALIAPAGATPVGIELSCTHHRSAVSGLVTGTSIPLHTGRTLATFAITITDDHGRSICTARLTCMYLPGRAD